MRGKDFCLASDISKKAEAHAKHLVVFEQRLQNRNHQHRSLRLCPTELSKAVPPHSTIMAAEIYFYPRIRRHSHT